ncbi:WSC domain-containing protein, partial [Gigaspora rosea]
YIHSLIFFHAKIYGFKIFFIFFILNFVTIKSFPGINEKEILINNSPGINEREIIPNNSGECFIPRDVPSNIPLGCYAFNNSTINGLNGLSNLGFSNVYKSPNNIMDPALCIIRCTDYIFDIAALKDGSQCQCGSASDFVASYIKVGDSNCNITCAGNSSYICGGAESYTIYGTKGGVPGHPQPTISATDKLSIIKNLNNDNRYQQCIKDSHYCGQRILNGTSKELAGMTVDKCIDFCRQNNFAYAGLEIGTQCFCANNYDHINQISSDQCSTSCVGNNQQICGGPLALSIYSVPTENKPPLKIILPCSIIGGVIILSIIVFIIYKYCRRILVLRIA